MTGGLAFNKLPLLPPTRDKIETLKVMRKVHLVKIFGNAWRT